MSALPGAKLVNMILRAIEVKPRLLVVIDCPWCDTREALELDPQESTYWCHSCNRRGRLETLEAFAQGEFLARHRRTRRLMEARPGVQKGGSR